GNKSFASIRGRSTIFGNPDPLIVVDDFPFEGNLDAINPNDVESITILKDAAAASLWGTRAGNGVIVITTKRGQLTHPIVNVSSGVGITNRPDLFSTPQMTTSEYIELQQFLFEKGFYTS